MPSGRITLLDDDAAAVRVLSLALKDYDLVTYRNVEGFLSGLDQEADCYLLDINMPGAALQRAKSTCAGDFYLRPDGYSRSPAGLRRWR